MKRKLPKFSSDEEFAEWVETHDLSDYLDSFEVVTEDMKVQRTSQKESIGVDLDARDVKAIKRVAKSKGVSYKALIKNWLIERLHQEASVR
ncbi:MAG: CopG family antitoxin [Pyrinomonadaceae bacterium]